MPKRCLVCSIFGIWFLFFFFFFFHSQSLPGSQPSPVTWIKDSVQFWSSQSQTHMYGLQKLQILTLKKTAFQPLSVWKIGLQKSVSQTCYYVAIQAEQTVSQVCFQGYSRQVPHNCHSLCLYKNVSCGAASFSVTERPFRCKSIWRNGLWWQNTKRASRASEFCHTHIRVLAFPVNSPAGLKILYTPFQAEHNLRTTPQPGTSSRQDPIVDVLTFLQGQPDRGGFTSRDSYIRLSCWLLKVRHQELTLWLWDLKGSSLVKASSQIEYLGFCPWDHFWGLFLTFFAYKKKFCHRIEHFFLLWPRQHFLVTSIL